MKIRLTDNEITARLTSSEVHALGKGDSVSTIVAPGLTFEVQVVDDASPQGGIEGPPYRIEIPRHALESPGPKNPTIYESNGSPHILIELDLAPSHR